MATSPILGFDLPYDGQQNAITTINTALLALEAASGSDFIHGLLLAWTSNSSITIATGAARLPNGALLTVSTPIVATVSVGASAWGHVFLYSNAGTPAVEVVTTNPANYFGTGHQKTGDASRRYIGSVRTNASGQVMKFYHQGDLVTYLENTRATPFRVLSAGVATVETAVSLVNIVPPTSNLAAIKYVNTSTASAVYIGNASERDATNLIRDVYVATEDTTEFPLSGAAMTYKYAGAPGAGAFFIDVQGYRFVR